MAAGSATKLPILIVAIAVSLLASFAAWYAATRPVAFERAWEGGIITSVSFAPFRRGQSPIAQRFPSEAQIEEDLAALKGKVAGVRTYTSTEGMEAVPRLAGKYGIAVTQGAWIGRDRARNQREVAALIEQANRHPDTIKRVIVGNEVLLRNELKADELAAEIRRVRQSIKQPVSYAEVWEYWLRYPQLAEEVDYITVHFLPYWEDEPVGVAEAMKHIVAVYEKVQKAFPGKPILIGEVGWPSAGRSRQGAVPGRVMQARFVDAFARLAHDRGMDYNLIEAFDQPWKTVSEGTVGGNWGILDAARRAKFPAAGPVVEYPHWRPAFIGAAIAGTLATLAILTQWPGTAPAVVLAFLAQALASMLAISAVYGIEQWYDKEIYGAPILQFALQASLAAFLFVETLRRLAAPAARVPVKAFASVVWRFRETSWRDRLMALFLLLAAYETLWLALRPDLPVMTEPLSHLSDYHRYLVHIVFHGRYRDFPIPEFLVPTLGFGLGMSILGAFGRSPWLMPSTGPRLDGAVVAVLVASILLLQWVEEFANREAMTWSLMALAMALLPALAMAARLARSRSVP